MEPNWGDLDSCCLLKRKRWNGCISSTNENTMCLQENKREKVELMIQILWCALSTLLLSSIFLAVKVA
jgi:hypothetical protein